MPSRASGHDTAKLSWSRLRRRKCGGCAGKDRVLTWGDLALCLKGRRCEPERGVSRGRSSCRARGEGPNEKESRRSCRLDVQGIRSPGNRGEPREGEVKPSRQRDAMKHGWRDRKPKAWARRPAGAGARARELGRGVETRQGQSRQCRGRWTDDRGHGRVSQDRTGRGSGRNCKRDATGHSRCAGCRFPSPEAACGNWGYRR